MAHVHPRQGAGTTVCCFAAAPHPSVNCCKKYADLFVTTPRRAPSRRSRRCATRCWGRPTARCTGSWRRTASWMSARSCSCTSWSRGAGVLHGVRLGFGMWIAQFYDYDQGQCPVTCLCACSDVVELKSCSDAVRSLVARLATVGPAHCLRLNQSRLELHSKYNVMVSSQSGHAQTMAPS